MGVNLRTSFFSPLRYPGGKGKLAFYIQLLSEANSLCDGHYVEPYAGGAAVGLSMLFNEYSSEIHLNDIDYRIYCFWQSAANQSDQLCQMIYDTEVNVETWKKQRAINRNPSAHNVLEVGFSTFFLNRTNRSGILKAGMIGGQEQKGAWKINTRYNKEELIDRILRIGRYRDRINIYNMDAISLITQLKKRLPRKTLFYFDPPYYKRGKELYINFYNHGDHKAIANLVSSMRNKFWIISYDNNENINHLYHSFRRQTYDLSYFAGKASIGSEILIFSNRVLIPQIENPTNKMDLKKYQASY